MLACQNGHAEVAKWLALAGANLEEKDAKMGTTALMFACIGGHYAAVRELLKAGANPDVRFDSEDNAVTPLMFATQYSGLMRAQKQPWAYFGAVVNILLKGGASVDLKDKKGRTALMFAAELGHPEVTGWLIEAGAELEAADQNGTRPLMYACKGAHVEVARVLLGAGADPTSANTKGSNALHFAASGGSLPIIRLLLEKGCDVDSANLDGDTSLGLAISAGKVGAVGYLVERADASLDITDKEGRSSLDLAAIMFSLFPEEVSRPKPPSCCSLLFLVFLSCWLFFVRFCCLLLSLFHVFWVELVVAIRFPLLFFFCLFLFFCRVFQRVQWSSNSRRRSFVHCVPLFLPRHEARGSQSPRLTSVWS
ncbi:unnamed protein product [Discosporangium mesarthrocarpum]